jgi:hypothetical protein
MLKANLRHTLKVWYFLGSAFVYKITLGKIEAFVLKIMG